MRRFVAQVGRHVDFVRVGCKMHQRALLELKQRRARVAILLVLFPGMSPVLMSPWILQFARSYRQSVYRKYQIDGVVLSGMTRDLADYYQPIFGIKIQNFLIQLMRRFEITEAKSFAVEFETVAKNVKRTL